MYVTYDNELVNAQEMNKLHLGTFDYPDRESIRPGSLVKVCNNIERFWVFVMGVDGDKLLGQCNNALVFDEEDKFFN